MFDKDFNLISRRWQLLAKFTDLVVKLADYKNCENKFLIVAEIAVQIELVDQNKCSDELPMRNINIVMASMTLDEPVTMQLISCP